MSLTRRCVTARTKPRIILFCLYLSFDVHHGSNEHLAYGDRMNLDCCKVMTITVDYGMTSITSDNLYSMLSCQPTPLIALSV
jgi:hypothetical protein